MNKTLMILAIAVLATGCSSVPGPDSKYSYKDQENTVNVTLSAPNLSNFHKPPINYSLAYIKVYDEKDVCEKKKVLFGEIYKQADPIGEIYVSKADRVKLGKLPVGKVVIQSGFKVSGGGGGMTCDRYFQFTVKEDHVYEVEVRESRPLVISCTVTISEQSSDGDYSMGLSDLKYSKTKGFLSQERDMSPICDGD